MFGFALITGFIAVAIYPVYPFAACTLGLIAIGTSAYMSVSNEKEK